jgi:hypothetical protein
MVARVLDSGCELGERPGAARPGGGHSGCRAPAGAAERGHRCLDNNLIAIGVSRYALSARDPGSQSWDSLAFFRDLRLNQHLFVEYRVTFSL